MISLKDKQFDPVCQKKFILFPNILYGGSWVRVFAVNRLDPREFIIEDLIELSLPKSVVFRKYIPQRIMDGSLVNFEFYMSNELTDPGIEEAPNSEYYGHLSTANSFVLESRPSNLHRLFTKVRIENEPSNIHR